MPASSKPTVSDRCAAPHAMGLSRRCSSAASLQHIALRRIRVHRVHNFMFTPLERNVWSKLAQAREIAPSKSTPTLECPFGARSRCHLPLRRDVICRFVNDAVRRFGTMSRASWLCSTRRSCPSPRSSSPTRCSPHSPRITSTRAQVRRRTVANASCCMLHATCCRLHATCVPTPEGHVTCCHGACRAQSVHMCGLLTVAAVPWYTLACPAARCTAVASCMHACGR